MKPWVLSFRRYSQIVGATVVILISSIVILGWLIQSESLIRINPRYPAMQFNTALCFLLLGGSLLCLAFEKKILVRILAIFVAAFTLITGLQYFIGVDFGIDELFFRYNISGTMQYPGRMALNSAFCFVLTSLALLLLTYKTKNKGMIALGLTSIVFSIAGVSQIGYLIGFESTAGFINTSRMAIHSSICFIVLSIPLLFVSFLESLKSKLTKYAFPAIGFLATIVATLITWQSFNTREFISIYKLTKQNSIFLKYSIEEKLNEEFLSLIRMAERWSSIGGFPEPLWLKDSKNYLKDISSLNQIKIFNAEWDEVNSKEKNPTDFFTLNIRSPDFQEKLRNIESVVTFKENPPWIYFSVPLFHDNVFQGALIAQISAIKLIDEVLNKLKLPDYLLLFQSKQNVFYAAGDFKSKTVGSPIEMQIDPKYLPWTVKVYVTASTLVLYGTGFQFLIVIIGIFFAIFFAIAIYFGVGIFEKNAIIQTNMLLLRQANERAQEASTAKGLFLANMSHEIRTPLNAVIGTIQLLAETNTDEAQKKYIRRIEGSSISLLNLLKDILDYSKIESGTVSLEPKEISIEMLIKSVVQGLSAKAREKGLDLLIDLPEKALPTVYADAYRLGQVISNLVNNAIKFTNKGFIIVRARLLEKGGASMRIEVQDTGIGIAKEDAAKLFEKFSQLESTEARKFGGIGLGLSICKRLVEMMKGKIGIISEVGKGSTFWIEIPFSNGKKVKEIRVFPEKKSYLLLDSLEEEKKILQKYLIGWGLQESENEASIVIATEEELASAQGKNLPILLLTNTEYQSLPEKVSAYLSRPIIPSEFYDHIQQILKR